MKFAPSQHPEHFNVLYQIKDGIRTLRDDQDMMDHFKQLPNIDEIDFNFQDEGFNSALFLAIANHKTQTVNFLLENGASKAFAVSEAFYCGNKAVLQQLISSGAEIHDAVYRKANSLLMLNAREQSPKDWFMDKANFKKDQQTQCAELLIHTYEKQHPNNNIINKFYIGSRK